MWFRLICTSNWNGTISKDDGTDKVKYIKILEDNFKFIKNPVENEYSKCQQYECKIWLEDINDVVKLGKLINREIIFDVVYDKSVIEIYDDWRE